MKALAASVAAVLFAGCGKLELPGTALGELSQNSAQKAIPQWQAQHLARAACPRVVGQPACLALQVLKGGVPMSCSGPSDCGWTATELEAAYNLGSKLGNGSGTKVALIEVGDLPNAISDFATYREAFGLGPGRLTKYNQDGERSHYPPSCEEYQWCGESDLDEDMVAAACPKCDVLMIEANGPPQFYSDIGGLEASETEAVKLGATILSNSWNCQGPTHSDCGDPNFPKYFKTPGITYLGASGDDGYDIFGPPSDLPGVIAVGGTQLAKSDSKYSETFGGDAGSGCAGPKEVGGSGVPKPSWQKDPDCKYRAIADVSAESGCLPGVAVYASIYGGWSSWCGTSVATPFTAGVIALAGNTRQLHGGKTVWTFNSVKHADYFNHPTGKGTLCRNYLCGNGRYDAYYSGPSGWGSPNGTSGY